MLGRPSIPLLSLVLCAACAAAPEPAAPRPPLAPSPSPVAAPPPEPQEAPVTFVLQDDFDDERFGLSRDGSLVASASRRGAYLRLWSARDRTLLARLSSPFNDLFEPTFGPTGRIVWGMADSRFCAWDLAHLPDVACFPLKASARPVLSENRALFGTRADDVLHIIDLATGVALADKAMPLDAQLRAIGDTGARVVWHRSMRNEVWTRKTDAVDTYPTGAPALSHDERLLALADEPWIKIFDLEKNAQIAELVGSSVDWSPGASRLVVTDLKPHTYLWEAASGLSRDLGQGLGPVHVDWLGDTRLAIFDGKRVRVFDVATGALKDVAPAMTPGNGGRVWPSPDGETAVLFGPDLRLLDAAAGVIKSTLAPNPFQIEVGFRSATAPIAVTRSPDGGTVYDLSEAQKPQGEAFPRHAPGKWVELWASGDALAARCDHSVTRWTFADGKQSHHPSADLAKPESLATSGDGRIAAVAGDLIALSDADGKELQRVPGRVAALSQSGSLLATWNHDNGRVSFFESATGRALTHVDVPGFVDEAHFRPGASSVLVASSDRGNFPSDVVLYDPLGKKVLHRFPRGARAPTFSADGSQLAFIVKNAVEVWSATSLTLVRRIPTRNFGYGKLSWSPDGAMLAMVLSQGSYKYLSVVELARGASIGLGGAESVIWRADSSGLAFRSGERFTQVQLVPFNLSLKAPPSVELRAGLQYKDFVSPDVVLAQSAGQSLLVRLSDGAELWLGVRNSSGKCSLFAYDQLGTFDGEPGSRVAFRVGDDARTAKIDASPARLAEHRQPELLKRFLAGEL